MLSDFTLFSVHVVKLYKKEAQESPQEFTYHLHIANNV